MNEVPTYQPPEGVHGPTLGRDLPDGCEWLGATYQPHDRCDWVVDADGYGRAPSSLFWWRPPPLKPGDRVHLTGTVTSLNGAEWTTAVRLNGDPRPGSWAFPTAALTRVVEP